MSTVAIESMGNKCNILSDYVSDFIGRFNFYDCFEGVFVNTTKSGGCLTSIIFNIVYDGSKVIDKILKLSSAFFELVSCELGLNIVLEKIDIQDCKDSSSYGRSLGDAKVILDKYGNLAKLQKEVLVEDSIDRYEWQNDDILTAIQYKKK